jgi:hypothetical protein
MIPHYQVSRDSADALREFSNEFRDALTLGEFETWAEQWGLVKRNAALKTTFPIPLSAAGYHEFKGDFKYRRLYERSLSMMTRLWQDGVEEFARVVEAPTFAGWVEEPARMAAEWNRLPNIMVADMLALSSLAGPLLDIYRDPDTNAASSRRLFAADHPYNVLDATLGTFDNRLTTTEADIASGAFFDAAELHFRSILGANGRPMGLKLGSCLVPSTRANLFKNTLQFDTIVRTIRNAADDDNVGAVTQNNIYKGTVGYTVADELADQDHFYIRAAGKAGLFPWAVLTGTLEEFVHDKTSARYKDSLKIAVALVGEAECAACLPHPIARVQITG